MVGEYDSYRATLVEKQQTTTLETSTTLSRKALRLSGERADSNKIYIDGFTLLDSPEVGHKHMESYLNRHIIGQSDAVRALVNAMDKSVVRLSGDNRPRGVFAFLGPTGVGKSQTAVALSEYLSAEKPNLIKIDCSDFPQGHEVSTLTGSPPGYVGHGGGGLLDKRSVEQHGTVVLFDEIEKGARELHDLLLQITGDGQLTMKDKSVTSFRDAIIILTSNLGAEHIVEHLSKRRTGFTIEDDSEPDVEYIHSRALEAFKKGFRPEFINRLDDMIVFNPLEKADMTDVLNLKLSQTNSEYSLRYGMEIALTDSTRQFLVAKAYEDRSMGARPLIRAFEKDIIVPFSQYLTHNQISQGTRFKVFHRDDLPIEYRPHAESDLLFGSEYDADLWEMREEVKRAEKRIEDEINERLRREKEEKKEQRQRKAIEPKKNKPTDNPSDESDFPDDSEIPPNPEGDDSDGE